MHRKEKYVIVISSQSGFLQETHFYCIRYQEVSYYEKMSVLRPECGKQSEQPTVKPNYDQYYDDVLPEDEGVETKRKGNSAVAVRVGLVVFALVLVISAGIAVLFLI